MWWAKWPAVPVWDGSLYRFITFSTVNPRLNGLRCPFGMEASRYRVGSCENFTGYMAGGCSFGMVTAGPPVEGVPFFRAKWLRCPFGRVNHQGYSDTAP